MSKKVTKKKRGRPPGTKRVGRPTKLNREVMTKIINAIRTGCYMETAAFYAGASKQSLYEWLKKGNRGECDLCVEFLDAVNKALADAELTDVDNIRKHAANDWRASAWRLERKNPQRWGTKVAVSATDKEHKDADESINEIIADELDKLEGDRFDD
jgi:hypothetical protein